MKGLDGCVLHGYSPDRTCVGCGRVLGPFWWKGRKAGKRRESHVKAPVSDEGRSVGFGDGSDDEGGL